MLLLNTTESGITAPNMKHQRYIDIEENYFFRTMFMGKSATLHILNSICDTSLSYENEQYKICCVHVCVCV